MTQIIFVCHGNICRSVMAEYIFKKMVKDEGLDSSFSITSAGVSSEEEGNDIYPPAKRVLERNGISYSKHYAHRITDEEFRNNDLVIALDNSNYRRLVTRFGNHDKIMLLLSRDVEDPWYTGDFERAYRDITRGCQKLLASLLDNKQGKEK